MICETDRDHRQYTGSTHFRIWQSSLPLGSWEPLPQVLMLLERSLNNVLFLILLGIFWKIIYRIWSDDDVSYEFVHLANSEHIMLNQGLCLRGGVTFQSTHLWQYKPLNFFEIAQNLEKPNNWNRDSPILVYNQWCLTGRIEVQHYSLTLQQLGTSCLPL